MEQAPSHTWLSSPNVSWRWVILTSVIWSSLLLAIQTSEVGSYLDARLARPVDFRVREAVGMGPTLSSKLRIFSFDDITVGQYGSWALSLEQWGGVFDTLAQSEPSAIVIDAMFSLGEDKSGNFLAAIDAARAKHISINAGAFFAPQKILARDALELDRPEYRLSNLLGRAPDAPAQPQDLPPMFDASEWYAYGPALSVRSHLSHIGHISYMRSGLVAPLIRMGPDLVFGHLSTYIAEDRHIEAGKLILNGHVVPVDGHGYLTVNFPSLRSLQDATKTMSHLKKLSDKKQLTLVQKGDIVLVLPEMFTGHTDFKDTPLGSIPGGYVVAAMLNSVMTGQWLKPLAGGEALTVMLVLLGALAGMRLGVMVFWSILILVMATCLVVSEYLFCYHGIIISWLMPVLGFTASSISVFAEKTRVGERKAQALRVALEGSVSPGELKNLLKAPELVSFEARERVVTLMFIDIVGFSRLAENMLPRIAFENLKKILSTLGDTVHAYGGIVDKTLGDGLLCYFGYHFDADASSPDHAEKALQCAIQIQRDNLLRNLEAAENGDPVYPLRIGINTSSCYLGDLGSQTRIDFTVVGNGVNFAKRLEGACDMHSVLIGATTNDLVKSMGLPAPAISKRFVRIKHHSELVQAYEYDPFYQAPELRLAAVEGFRKCANIDRIDQRWPVHDPTKIQLSCDSGEAQLVNFSHTGFSIKLKHLLARGTRLTMTIDSGGGALKAMLARENISILHGEVRWGYAEGAEYVHGVLISNLEPDQSDVLVQYLCEFAFQRDSTESSKKVS